MPRRLTEPDDRGPVSDPRDQRNRNALIVFFLVCSGILLLASGAPAVLIAPALSQLFSFASLAATFVAVVGRERLFADHLTHWDQAAAFLALSLLAGAFADPAAIGEFMARLHGAAPTGMEAGMEAGTAAGTAGPAATGEQPGGPPLAPDRL